ncbi:MAG: hypothetical protein ACYDHY_07525 [Acidiferrobacterales bacterium]
MAIHYFTNQEPATWAACVYAMVQTLSSAGWQTIAYSNGSHATNSPVTNVYPYGSGNIGITSSLDLANNGSWIVLQQPPVLAGTNEGGGVGFPYSGNRQIVIQRSTSGLNYAWRIKYSFSGGYTSMTGTAVATPGINTSIGDEVYLLGGGTDNAPTFQNMFNISGEGAARMNFFADDGSVTGTLSGSLNFVVPNPSPYAFWGWTAPAGTSTGPNSGQMMDPIVTGSFATGSALYVVDPFVFYFEGAAAGTPFSHGATGFGGDTTTGPGARTWFRYGLQNANFGLVGAGYYAGSVNTVWPQGAGSNPETTLEDVLPIPWIRSPNAPGFGGYKGMSSLCKWFGSSRSYASTFTFNFNRDRIVVDDVVLPWDTSVPLV